MFTATPVTVPACCLPGRKPFINTQLPAPALCPSSPFLLPVLFIPLDPLPGLIHLDVLVAMARDAQDTPQGITDAGGEKQRGAEHLPWGRSLPFHPRDNSALLQPQAFSYPPDFLQQLVVLAKL